jgi:multidrug transporter EmrE-like cation transporter
MIEYVLVYVVLSTSGLVILRSRLGGGQSLMVLAHDPRVLLGAACYAASFLTWLLALRKFELVRAFPVFMGSSYAAVTVAAVLVLGERLSTLRGIGIALVGFGVLLVYR